MDIEDIQSVKQRFGIIGNAPSLNRAIEVAMLVAPKDSTVLITGESGSGKESFSKIIHQLSHRKHGEFIALNCGALPEGTIDSELFGHEKGAFTGATEARKGYFEVTDKGTIFLDEIAEMPLETQARLLRLLENREFIKVGSSKIRKTDVRVVAATNVDLWKHVEDGKFRKDLYYRLSTIPIYVPPLRERGDDILLLFRKFSSDFAEINRAKPLVLDEQAQHLLMGFRFPGNIRQLKNIAEQMSVMESDRFISAETLRRYLPANQSNYLPALVNQQDRINANTSDSFSERDLLYKVLFELKRDVAELKKIVLGMGAGPGVERQSPVYAKPDSLMPTVPHAHDTHTDDESDDDGYLSYVGNEGRASKKTLNIDTIDDITHEMEDESFSLQKNEKEMIVKALKKNSKKRKDAARDLGISERTLYRKIKLYDIDE
ncbi:sigma-54 dependent transcriptional regulator [Flammeovirgaceae bacterium SG7u.111]|nr:sigma-54 dependent transcriptional regulator [Flammeovirgaceae bacterium SG7u.132]WPO34001.1 sigma-54 dependent transcriptional regulator [Flammeovirgaceae bacterium SG7u.111]